VMKNGELYEGDTLNMVWPEARPLPKQFWWETEPTSGPARPTASSQSSGGRLP
jgi:hypothetical protein